MKKKLLTIILSILMMLAVLPVTVFASDYTVNGIAINGLNSEPFTAGGTLHFTDNNMPENKYNVEIGNDGKFSLAMPEGKYTVEASSITGYKMPVITIDVNSLKHDDYIIRIYPAYRANFYCDVNGNVSSNGFDVIKGSTYTVNGNKITFSNEYEDSQVVTATPRSGYQFANWTINGNPASSGTIDELTAFTANFEVAYIKIDNSTKGTVNYNGPFAYEAENTVYYKVTDNKLHIETGSNSYDVLATANEGYKFSYWEYKYGSTSGLASENTLTYNDISEGGVTFTPEFETTYKVTGTVTDNDSQPLEGVTVNLYDGYSDLVACGTTDASGKYNASGLTYGEYDLVADKEGYASYTKRLSISEEDVTEDFVLKEGGILTYSSTSPFVALSCDYKSGTGVPAGENVDLTVGIMAFAPIQVNYLTCNELGKGDYTSSGNKITFTMPKKDVLIQANVTGVIGNVDLSLNVPATGATSIIDPVIDSKNNYKLNYVELIDADNNEVNEENPIVKGKKYIAIIALKAKDNYAFAYKGDLLIDGGVDADDFKYNVTTKVNGETIKSYADESELTSFEKSGYIGGGNLNHYDLSIIYVFTAEDPVAELVDFEGNSTSYTDLSKALADAKDFDTVKLLTDIDTTEDINVGTFVSLDLNHHTINTTGKVTNDGTIILHKENADIIDYLLYNVPGAYGVDEELSLPDSSNPVYVVPANTFMTSEVDENGNQSLNFASGEEYLVWNTDVKKGTELSVTYSLTLGGDIIAPDYYSDKSTDVEATHLKLNSDITIGSNEDEAGFAYLSVFSIDDSEFDMYETGTVTTNSHKIILNKSGALILSDDIEFDDNTVVSGVDGMIVEKIHDEDMKVNMYLLENEQRYENKPFEIKEGYTGTLEFITTADYVEDGDVVVEVDGKLLDESKYDLAHGSTHVTLHGDYVKTLSAGKHTMTIAVLGYNTISQEFIIIADNPSPAPYIIPNTSVRGIH